MRSGVYVYLFLSLYITAFIRCKNTVDYIKYAFGVACHIGVVRYHYNCRTLGIEPAEELHYLLSARLIERAGGFVRKEYARVVYHGSRYGYPLFLTAGKLGRKMRCPVTEPYIVQSLVRAFVALMPRGARVYEGERNVVERLSPGSSWKVWKTKPILFSLTSES